MSKYLEAVLLAQKQGLLSRQNAQALVIDEIDNAKIKAAFDIFKQANVL